MVSSGHIGRLKSVCQTLGEEMEMTQEVEKRRAVLLRRLKRVDAKIVRLKKVLARLQAHLEAVKPKKTAAA